MERVALMPGVLGPGLTQKAWRRAQREARARQLVLTAPSPLWMSLGVAVAGPAPQQRREVRVPCMS
jgi:hypothetical protein